MTATTQPGTARLIVIDRRHWYTADGLTAYPSVTTLLNKGWPKEALVGWAAKVTAEYAIAERRKLWAIAEVDEKAAIELVKSARWNLRDRAADRGTAIHEMIASGRPPAPEEQPYRDAYDLFLADHKAEVLAQELPFVADGYGGTTDLITRMEVAGPAGGDPVPWEGPIDLKTGGVYDNHHGQVAAYARGLGYNAGAILALTPDPTLGVVATFHPVDIPSAYRAFRAAKELAHYLGVPREMVLEGPDDDSY
jgi:hypothetical protein